MIEDTIAELKPAEGLTKVALFMEYGFGYSTRNEVHFNREHPYQLVDADELNELIQTGRFRIATPQEIKEFYSV